MPTAAAEAARQLSRERTALTRERTRLLNQMRGWLSTWCTTLPLARGRVVGAVTDWAGSALPASLQTRQARASELLALVETQRTALDPAQHAESARRRRGVRWRASSSSRGIGDERDLAVRKASSARVPQSPRVGGLLGFTATPYASGGRDSTTKGSVGAGNHRLQVVSTQLAWGWLHRQP